MGLPTVLEDREIHLTQTRGNTFHKRNNFAASSNTIAQKIFALGKGNNNCRC